MDAFHSTNIFGNLVQNRMEQNVSGYSRRKFRSTPRGCPFFSKNWKSGYFLFHLPSLPGLILALVPLVVNLASTKATRWRRDDTTLDENDLRRACSRLPIFLKTLGSEFPNFLRASELARFPYSTARKVRKFLSSHENNF